MDESTAQGLLDEASEHYNGGRYQEAIRLWEEVLEIDPGNQKARDGIQMASLLADQFSGASAPEPESSELDDTAPVTMEARVQAGIGRVRELLASGHLDEALEGCRLIEGLAPDSEEVQQLVQQVKAAAGGNGPPAAESDSDLDSLLADARQALEEGRNEDAAAAAMRAAEMDPGNTEACGIISLLGGDQAVGQMEPPEPATDEPPMPALDLDGALTQAISAESGPTPDEDVTIPEPEIPQPEIPELTISTDVALPTEPADRIAALIQEGQTAFDSGQFEAAIEAWSRVFAVDQADNQAGPLIDQAKEAIENRARELEQMLYNATDAREAGRTEEAIEICNAMLQKNPGHVDALALLDELESGVDSPGESEGEEEITIGIDRQAIAEAAAEKGKETEKETVFDESVPLSSTPEETASPTKAHQEEPGLPPPDARPRGGTGRLLAAAVVAIVAAAGAGWYFWFGGPGGSGPRVQMTPPPPSPKPPVEPPASTQVQQQNASLQVLPVTPAPEQPSEPVPDREPPDMRSKARSLEKQGRRHFANGDWTASVLSLREAKQLDPVHFNSEPMLDEAMERLEIEARLERQVRKAVQSFTDKDYASALYSFYRLQESDENGRRYERHISNSWFNWGVTLLRDGAVDEAREKFAEVRDIVPGDSDAARAIKIIDRYENRIVDEAFDSFVASLRLRTIE